MSKKLTIYIILIIIFLSMLLPVQVFAADGVPTIYSPAVLLMEYDSGKILFEKDMNKKMYPASLTKVLTALITLEKCKLEDVATVSSFAVNSLPLGYVSSNIKVGEELTVTQLLNLLLIPSANDAAIVLAEHISGSSDEFAKLMNIRAKELGCKGSNFTNPYGLHDKEHYTTAYDLALIAKEAMKYEVFRDFVDNTTYILDATNKYKKADRYYYTTNELLLSNDDNPYYYKDATGIKTGFTTPAQNCLIAASNRNNLEFITVVLGGGVTDKGQSEKYLDTIGMFNFGYNTYSLKEVATAGQVVHTINVKGATNDTKKLNVSVNSNIWVLSKIADIKNGIQPDIQLNESLKAPISKGTIIGKVTYISEGIPYTYDLIANSDVKISYAFRNVLIAIGVVLVVLVVLRIRQMKRRQRYKNYRKNRDVG